jgi:hypothetical protein
MTFLACHFYHRRSLNVSRGLIHTYDPGLHCDCQQIVSLLTGFRAISQATAPYSSSPAPYELLRRCTDGPWIAYGRQYCVVVVKWDFKYIYRMQVAHGGYSPGECAWPATTTYAKTFVTYIRVTTSAPNVPAADVFGIGIFHRHLVP